MFTSILITAGKRISGVSLKADVASRFSKPCTRVSVVV